MRQWFRGVALALTLLIAPAITACSSLPPVSAVSTQNTVLDERALWAAEAAYNVPAQAYVRADQDGTLPASVKATVQPLLIKAYAALKAARSAYAIGDAANFNAQIAAAKSLAAQAKAIVAPGS